MKEGWEYMPLGEICDVLDSKRKPITKNKRQSGNIPYYGATGLLDYVKEFLFDEKLVLLGEDGAKWNAGDISAYIIEGKSWVNNHAHVLRPKRQLISDEYLTYYLNFSDLSGYITGVTVPKLNQEKMRGITVPVPPLPEQQRIVEYLDTQFAKIDALKANAAQQLQAAKDLFQSALKDLMTPKEGWVEKKLPEISQNLDKKRIPITQNKREQGIYPYYGASGIVDYVKDYIFDDTLLLISEDGANLIARATPIAFTISGKTWVNNHSHVLKFDDDILREYVEYYFANLNVEEYITGAAQPKLTQSALNKIGIYIPNNNEEIKSIVEKLDSYSSYCKQLQSNYEQTITLCNDLKQSLLKQIFE